MKKHTLKSIRAEAWKVLTQQVRVINVVPKTPHSLCAHSLYDDSEIEIWTDAHKVSLDDAVVHEILHKMLDHDLEQRFTYTVYEKFINSLEKDVFRKLPYKEQARWRRAIAKKTVHKRE